MLALRKGLILKGLLCVLVLCLSAGAAETEQKLTQTQERLIELEGEISQIGDDQIREMAQEQINLMKQEIESLQTQVRKEKQSRGIFGFLSGS